MANLDFPTSPVTGQIYSANGKTWRFDGVSWKSYNTLGIASGGTGLTSINAANAFLSSDSAGTALTYRIFKAGAGITLSVDTNSVLFTSTGGTVNYGSANSLAYYNAAGYAITGAEGLTFDSTNRFLTANKFIGNLSATAATSNKFYGDLVGSATSASSVDLVNATTDIDHSLIFSDVAFPVNIAGHGLSVSSQINYNPSKNKLSLGMISGTSITASDYFYGDLQGASNSSHRVDIDEAFDDNNYNIVMFKGMHGTGIALSTRNTLYYNPNSKVLVSDIFQGNVSGTFITASSGFKGDLTGTASTSNYSHNSGYAITSGTASSSGKWTNSRTVYFATGDVTGNFSIDGSSDVSNVVLSIGPDSVALGTDTTGQYASTLSTSGSGITVTLANASDGTAYTIYSSATDANTNSSLVFRNSSGNFSANQITANSFIGSLSGNATTAFNVNIVDSTIDSTNYVLFTPISGSQSGGAVSSSANITFNPVTKALSLSDGELTVDSIRLGNSIGKIDTTSGNLTLDSAGGTVNLNDNLIVQGNLTVQGTTTTVDSTVTSILDPVIVLGAGAGNTHSTTDDNKDRGIEFRYAESGSAITGFFGYKDDKKFYYIPNAAISSENVYTGTAGTIVANLEGNASTSSSAAKWTTARTVTFSGGDVTGNFSIDGSADVSNVNLTIGANSVALGTDTTGQYASTISINGLGITATTANGDDSTAYTIYSSASSATGSSLLVIRDINGGFAAGIVTATEFLGNISGSAATFSNFYGTLTGLASTASNISINSANTSSQHKLLFTPDVYASGSAVSTNSTLVYNPATDILSVSGLAVTSNTSSTSTSTGSLIITGGVGIGGSLYTNTSNSSSVSGIVMNNSSIVSGQWNSTAIGITYGGTGLTSYAKGDLLVGDLNGVLSRFPVDGNGSVLIGSSFSGYGVSWQPILTPTYGAFASTTTQVATAAGSTVLHFNTIFEKNRVNITPIGPGAGETTRVYIQDTGTYNFQFSAQMILTSGASAKQGEIWFRFNGVDEPESNSVSTVQGNNAEVIMTVNTIKTVVANSYVELVMYSSDAAFGVAAQARTGRPNIPSLIFTVHPVAGLVESSGTAISGLASLNNQIGNIQTFATSTTGSDFNISSSSDVHTFSIPSASVSARGLVTNSSQTFGGNKTFAGAIAVTNSDISTSPITGSIITYGGLGVSGSASIGGTLSLFDTTTTNSIGFVVGALTGSTVYVLPTTTPQSSSGTSVLSSTIDGVMSWVPMTATGTGGGGAGTVDSGLAFQVPYYYSGTAITGSSGLINIAGSGVTITYTADTTSKTTGALVVTGGVGIGGSLSLGNRISLYNGANFTSFVSSATANTAYLLPPSTPAGTANSVLQSTPSGILSWVPMAATSTGVNVATGSGNTNLYLLSANDSNGSGLAVSAVSNVYYNPAIGTSFLYAPKFNSTNSEGAEGGEFVLNKAVTSTFNTSVTIDINGDRLRFFETGGSNRGFYLDITTGATAVGTNIMGSSSSGTVNSGTANHVAFYPGDSNAVSSNANIQFTGSGISIGGFVNSTNSSSGSLFVHGGLGVTGNAFIGGTVTSSGNITAPSFIGNLTGLAVTSSSVSIISTNSSTIHPILFTPSANSSGSAISANGTLVYDPSNDRLTSSGISITSTDNATSTSTGALRLTAGGMGIVGNAFIGGTVYITNTTNSTSINSGALEVDGGVAIGQSVSVGGRIQLFNSSLFTAFASAQSGISTVYTLPATTPQSSAGTSVLSSTIEGVMSWVPMTASSPGGSGTVGSGAANKLAYYSAAGTAVTDTYGMNYNLSGTASTFTIFGGASLGNTAFVVQAISSTSVRVGIGITNPQYALEVEGEISATSKSFVIDHPTKPGMKLRYGSLEGPENGVYVRGMLTNEFVIETPDYWRGLVDQNTFSVNLTPIGNYQNLFIERIEDYKVYVGTADTYINCYYSIFAERKDVPKFEVEY